MSEPESDDGQRRRRRESEVGKYLIAGIVIVVGLVLLWLVDAAFY